MPKSLAFPAVLDMNHRRHSPRSQQQHTPMNPLMNDGIAVIGLPEFSRSGITVVVGVARGGTSLIAGSLYKLGLFMGDRACPPVFEDTLLSDAFDNKRGAVDQIVKRYTEEHGTWGWKRPSVINSLPRAHELLNAPRYIFIFKDILSIARRKNISSLTEIFSGMEQSLEEYRRAITFLQRNKLSAMLVSYEKAVMHPESMIEQLIHFCDLSPSEAQTIEATHFITPDPVHYLEHSRVTKAVGRLDGFSAGRISGWARMVHTQEPARVQILINDALVATVIADQKMNSSQETITAHRFFFAIPATIRLTSTDVIRARVVSEVRDLENSPTQPESCPDGNT